MKKITITIETTNAAFDGDPYPEVARILHDLAVEIGEGLIANSHVRDTNGNTVGTMKETR